MTAHCDIMKIREGEHTMPYGYENYRLSKNISENTVVHEVRLIRSLLAFINAKYKRSIEPYEIRPIDIKEFLDAERATGLQDTTINRKLVYIRHWFDFMWRTNKIPIDFMPKLDYSKNLVMNNHTPITINYLTLLNKRHQFLRARKIQLHSKLLFIFFIRGLRIRDILRIELDDFEDRGNVLYLHLRRIGDEELLLKFDNDDEISTLLMAIERAMFSSSPYILYSRINEEYVPLRMGSLKDYHLALKHYFGIPIRSEELRFSYVHYLYRHENKSIEEIQQIMGLTLATTTRLLKESLERLDKVNYNVINDHEQILSE